MRRRAAPGLLYALDHHPDHQDKPRGDALRGARDPIRVLGHRLRPWAGRLADLPRHLVGLGGNYQLEQAQRLARRLATDTAAAPVTPGEGLRAAPSTRLAARHALAAYLAELRRRRSSTTARQPPGGAEITPRVIEPIRGRQRQPQTRQRRW